MGVNTNILAYLPNLIKKIKSYVRPGGLERRTRTKFGGPGFESSSRHKLVRTELKISSATPVGVLNYVLFYLNY